VTTRALARAAAATLADDSGVGSVAAPVGARRVLDNDAVAAMIAPEPGGLVRLLLPSGPALEVEPAPGRWRYRARGIDGLIRGGLVAGLIRRGAPGPLPLGRLRSRVVARRGPAPRMGVVEVGWAASEATLIAESGDVRALLPVTWRRYDLAARGGALQLRRRDDGGRWQPVVDGLLGVRIDYLVDRDGDARADGGLTRAPNSSATIVGARIRAEAVIGDWAPVVVERWVRVGL